MFCPVCEDEYRQGYTRCADCNADLVESLEPESLPEPPAPAIGTAAAENGASPERLICVSWYPTLAAAEGESRILREAGFHSYLGGDSQRFDGPVEVLVAESQWKRARALLRIEEDVGVKPGEPGAPDEEAGVAEAAAPAILVCPDCGSPSVYRMPPYAFRVFAASVAVLAVAVYLGRTWLGVLVLVAGWVSAIWLSRHSGHYRCRLCGREWKPLVLPRA